MRVFATICLASAAGCAAVEFRGGLDDALERGCDGLWFAAYATLTLHRPPARPAACATPTGPLTMLTLPGRAQEGDSVQHVITHPVLWARSTSPQKYAALCRLTGETAEQCDAHNEAKRVATWCLLNRAIRRAALEARSDYSVIRSDPAGTAGATRARLAPDLRACIDSFAV